jgi:hypothetical protein
MRRYWQRAARTIGWDRNPLRRPVDRVEAAIMTVLVAALVIAAPLLAVYAGKAAFAAGLRERAAERGWYQAPAVLLQSPAEVLDTSSAMDIAWVRAQWTTRGGNLQTGTVAVALNAPAGQRVEVWLTSAGRPAYPPLTSAEMRDQEICAALVAIVYSSVGIGAGALAVRVIANRKRMASWEQEWDAAGPQWSQRR